MSQQSHQQQSQKKPEAAPPARVVPAAPAIPAGMTPAWFTSHELLALQRICRDGDDERGAKILADAVKRADRS